MVFGPFLSDFAENPWLDKRSSKSFSETLGFWPMKGEKQYMKSYIGECINGGNVLHLDTPA